MKTLAWMARNTTLASGKTSDVCASRRRLVASERGANAVEAALEDTAFDETFLVADTGGGIASDLPLRVATRLGSLERQRRTLTSATLVLAGEHGSQAMARRELVARTLLAHLQAAGGGELILLASSGERDGLLELVEKLLRELDTRGVSIRLQFRHGKARRAPTAATAAAAARVVS
jgi:hypothetical protein